MLCWAQTHSIFCFLDSNQYTDAHGRFECLLAVGAQAQCAHPQHSLQDLDAFLEFRTWAFGHFSYECKNLIHPATSVKEDALRFPLFYFFEPQYVIALRADTLIIWGPDADTVWQNINATETFQPQTLPVVATPLLSKDEYLNRVSALQAHIGRGDCYEINFCQQYRANKVSIDPVAVFQSLLQQSPTPFAGLYRINDCWLISSSPERFLKKEERNIWSQPMKGTISRGKTVQEDEAQKKALASSEKDRAENVMVVDLVRNDLSQVCEPGSVMVEELFGLYPFPRVHQMVSTVKGVLKNHVSFSQIIKSTFPMGSMTGAPKASVMNIIDRYEPTARGIFSGALGYVHKSDFDFNVVIRSISYNAQQQELSFGVGSGITAYSEPQKEWEECELKAAAIKKVLQSQ